MPSIHLDLGQFIVGLEDIMERIGRSVLQGLCVEVACQAGEVGIDRGPRPGIAEDPRAHGRGELGIGFQLFRRGKLGTADGLFKLHGQRLPGLDRQRQLRRGHGDEFWRVVANDLLFDQSRREDRRS